MGSWFERRDRDIPEAIPADREDLLDAYKEGRKDERTRVVHDGKHERIDAVDVRQAYERGRRDERARHRGSPLAALLVLLVAMAGGAVLFLAAREGSFTRGGEVIDRNVQAAAQTAQAPIRNAADNTGNALRNAGDNIKDTAGSGKK